MKYLILLLFIIANVSCKKDSNNTTAPTFENFIDKYQVCDSVVGTIGTTSETYIYGKGKGMDVVYSSNGTYQIYLTPRLTRNYKYESPNKIYFWDIGTSMNPNTFMIIKSMNGNKIVYLETIALTTYAQYYTVE